MNGHRLDRCQDPDDREQQPDDQTGGYIPVMTIPAIISLGSTLNFEVRGLRREPSYFTSFYLYSATRRVPHAVRARTWPRITRFDDRWPWIVKSVVPRFRKFDADARLVDASLRRIVAEARAYTSHACVPPPSPQADALAT